MNVEIFESAKKNLRIQKYPDTCGQGLRFQRLEWASDLKRQKKNVWGKSEGLGEGGSVAADCVMDGSWIRMISKEGHTNRSRLSVVKVKPNYVTVQLCIPFSPKFHPIA